MLTYLQKNLDLKAFVIMTKTFRSLALFVKQVVQKWNRKTATESTPK